MIPCYGMTYDTTRHDIARGYTTSRLPSEARGPDQVAATEGALRQVPLRRVVRPVPPRARDPRWHLKTA